jgi:NAD(P)-dependent dehydrogenase (short-subunit alcohol dehydrogenase family)
MLETFRIYRKGKEMDGFQGKRIVLTGASRGVGFEAAKLFLAAGAEIIGTGRDPERLKKATADLQKIGKFYPVLADFDNPTAPSAVAAEVSARWPALDMLLNNAAVQTYKTATSATSTSFVAAAQYNLGMATLIGGYASNDTGTVKESGVNVGVKVPLGADYIAAAVSSYDAGAGAKTGFGVNYIKAMGKSTVGYLGYSSVDSVNKTGAGLRFNF